MRLEIIKLLEGHDLERVEKFASYCERLLNEKESKPPYALKNPWMQKKTPEGMAELFRRVDKDGLIFDGEHITLSNLGISYDYIAYKNKMLLAYPESQVDVSLVYEGDEFTFEKESGSVHYSHKIKDPFAQKNVVGGYCIIKNKRGEFLTLLSREEIDKHRKVAKTDYIWAQWFKEMSLKTVIKKACKQHFADIYTEIEELDNENYSLENPLELDLKFKGEIDAIQSLEELRAYYLKNKGRGKEFEKYLTIRSKQLTQAK